MSADAQILVVDRPAWYARPAPIAYSLLLVAVLVLTFGYKLRIDGIFSCPSAGYRGDSFLSDCTANTYGDYDHGAFWFGLEPKAQDAAAAAQVLFVGNSRLQFAMSSAASEAWFASSGVTRYLLGFSNSETVAFFAPLLARLHPHASAYVLNVDRLFDDRVSPPTEEILHRSDAMQRYLDKQKWQGPHRLLCDGLPGICGTAVAIYRSRSTGVWHRFGTARFVGHATSDGQPSNVGHWSQYAQLAKQFVAKLPVDRECVILTVVPTVNTKREEAQALADALGLPLVSPRLDGLRTFDGSHLDADSAERWSAAFLAAAGPRLRQCARGRAAG